MSMRETRSGDSGYVGWYRASTRSLLLLIGVVAILLTPAVLLHRQRLERARLAMLQAREVAIRSVIREERRHRQDVEGEAAPEPVEVRAGSAGAKASGSETPPPSSVDQLLRENRSLRVELEELRRKLEKIKDIKSLPGRRRGE